MVLFGAAAHSAPRIYLGESAGPVEGYAAVELQRYLYASTGELYPVEAAASLDAHAEGFALGTPRNLPKLPEAYPFGLETPIHDGYVLHSLNGGDLVVIAGPTAHAVQNGVYGLLEDFGIGFYLDGDRIPTGMKLKTLPRFHESRSPALEVRGTLLRDTYFAGPAAWSFADYRQYIDRLAALRINSVVLYASVDGPFAGDAPLPDTSKGPWHNAPLATSRYLAGTGEYFADDSFGGPGATAASPEEGVREARDTLRRAFAYAKARGLRVGLGLDATGDPTDPAVQAAFEARLRTVLREYPALDSVWVWAPELAAVSATPPPASRSLLASYAERWEPQFAAETNPGRRVQAVRHCLFLLQAQRVLEALRPDAQLASGAWGGDRSWRFTDFFEGMDRILSPGIAFGALDDMPIGNTISAVYGRIASERDKWPALWLEADGDLWMPQPNLDAIAAAHADALAKNCDGLFGLHWRTSTFDDPVGYFARLAWRPMLTPDDYLARRARDLYGAALGAEMAPYLVRLEDLGNRWVGGLGQYEPAPFLWSGGEETERNGLVQVGSELRAKLNQEKLLPSLLPDITAPLEWSRDLIGMPLDLVKAPLELGRRVVDVPLGIGRQVLEAPLALGRDLAGAVLPAGAPPEWRAALEGTYAQLRFVAAYDRAARALDGGEDFERAQLAETLHLYARHMRSKGDLGALAEMNAKAWAAAREGLGGESRNLSSQEALPEVYRKQPQLVVLPDRVIVVGADPERCRPVLKARPLGGERFVERPLELMGRSSFAVEFPDEANGWDAFEYGVEVDLGKGVVLAWPLGFPEVTATAHTLPVPDVLVPAFPAPEPAVPTLHAETVPEQGLVRLAWDARPGCSYTVLRNGQTLGAVYDGWFVDNAPAQGNRYEVRAQYLGGGEAFTSTVDVWGFVPPLPQPPAKVYVASRGGFNLLAWDSDSPLVAEYVVSKFGPGSEPVGQFRVPADHGHRLRFVDAADQGRAFSYTVAGVATDGRPGPATHPVGIIVSPQPLEPVATLSVEDESKLLDMLALVGANDIALGGAGWSELPRQPQWDPDKNLSVVFRVKVEELNGMPVLVCRGPWEFPAYYIQVWDKGLRFHLAGVGTLDAGTLTPGEWHRVAAVYGDGEMQLYLDGKLAGRTRAGDAALPTLSGPILARHGVRGDPGFLDGALDDFSFYRSILAPQEIEALGKGQ
jgi:hypothetical protein